MVIMRHLRFILLTISLLVSCSAIAQQSLEIIGAVKEGTKPLSDVKVTLMKNGAVVRHVSTNASGKFNFTFEPNANYLIVATRDGYVSKSVSFATKVPADAGPTWDFDFIIDLFKDMPGLDKAVFRNPVAKVYYNPSVNDFDYDLDYAMDFQRREREAMQKMEELKINKEKEEKVKAEAEAKAKAEAEKVAAEQAKKQAAELKAKQQQFEGILSAAENLVKQKKLDDALAKFREAEKMFPEDFRPNQRIEELTAIIEANKAKEAESKAKDDQFASIKARADQQFVAGQLSEAKATYQEALRIKPEQKEITDLIKQIDTQIAQKAKEADDRKKREAEVDQLVKQGDDQFKSGNFADAKATFQRAAVLSPDDQKIKTRLGEATSRLEEENRKANEQAALQKEFDRLMADGNKAEKSGDLIKAKDLFAQANGKMPGVAAANEALTRVNTSIAAKAQQEEETRKADERHAALLADAQKKLAEAQFDEAVRVLQEADKLKPGNKEASKLLSQAQAGAEQRKKEEEANRQRDQQFATLMSEGRTAVQKQAWDQAIAQFDKATKLKPDNAEAQTALKNAQDQKAALAKAADELKKKEAQYLQYLRDGEAALVANDFNKAEGIYFSATELLPDRTEASVQLVKIRAELERRARQEAEQAQRKTEVEVLLSEAEKLFSQENLEAAKLTFKRVLEIVPGETKATSRIKEIDGILAQRENEKKKREDAAKAFDRFMAAGNEALNAKKYDQARAAYASAAEQMPESTEPARKIKEIDDALARIKMDEDRQLATDQQYVDKISQAESSFKGGNLDEALTLFRAASTLKPNEKLPLKRISEIESLISDKRRKEDSERAQEAARLEAEQARARAAEEQQKLAEERARLEEDRKRAEADAERLAEEERKRKIEEAKAKELEKQRLAREAREQEEAARKAKAEQFAKAEKMQQEAEEARLRAEREARAAKEAEEARKRQEEEERNAARFKDQQEETILKNEREKQRLEEENARAAEAEAARMEKEAEAMLQKKIADAEARMRAEVEAKLRKEFEEKYANDQKAAEIVRQAELAKQAQVERDNELKERERIKEEQFAEAQRIARERAEEEERVRIEAEQKRKVEEEKRALDAKLKAQEEQLAREEAEVRKREEQNRIEAERAAERAAELEQRKMQQEEQNRVAREEAEKAKLREANERLAREEAQKQADMIKTQAARVKAEEERQARLEAEERKKIEAANLAAQIKEKEIREKQSREELEKIKREEQIRKEQQYREKLEFEKKVDAVAKQSAAAERGGFEEEVRKKLQAEYDAKRATLGLDQVKKNTEDALKAKPTAFQQELANKYPKGVTEERDVKPNQEITIVVVNRGDGFPNEYRRVKWNWGGLYYFKNGESTSKQIFEQETAW